MKNKIFDCVTFFQENLLTNMRFEILNEVADYFVICESKYDHRGNNKNLNISLPIVYELHVYIVSQTRLDIRICWL